MDENKLLFFVFLNILVALISFFLYKIYIKYATYHQIYAYPTSRSAHKSVLPTGGGIVFGFLHIIFICFASYGIDNLAIIPLIYKLSLGSFLIILVGAFDDKYMLQAKYKLFFQIIISLIMINFGFRISLLTNPLGVPVNLGFLSVPITIFWYLIVINAINLIDGLDGLAAGITVFSCLILLIFSFFNKNFFVFINCNFIIINLIIFLLFNFPHAKLFMGDTGSLFIGFLLASLSIGGNEAQFKGLTTFTLLVPITVLIIPLGDTFFTICRRVINHQPIFSADKKHVHHQLLNLGLSPQAVTILCWFITLIFGIVSLGYLFVSTYIMLLILIIILIICTGLFLYIYKKELFK